jgi:hypothetical protein
MPTGNRPGAAGGPPRALLTDVQLTEVQSVSRLLPDQSVPAGNVVFLLALMVPTRSSGIRRPRDHDEVNHVIAGPSGGRGC